MTGERVTPDNATQVAESLRTKNLVRQTDSEHVPSADHPPSVRFAQPGGKEAMDPPSLA